MIFTCGDHFILGAVQAELRAGGGLICRLSTNKLDQFQNTTYIYAKCAYSNKIVEKGSHQNKVRQKISEDKARNILKLFLVVILGVRLLSICHVSG
jgi:hypothetical protein